MAQKLQGYLLAAVLVAIALLCSSMFAQNFSDYAEKDEKNDTPKSL